MCIYAAEQDLKKPLILFVWLKLMFREGKFKIDVPLKKVLCYVLNYKDIRSLDSLFFQLEKVKWIKFNSITGYYIITSYKVLKIHHCWNSKQAILAYPEYLKNQNAFIGAALYSYLYKDFKRKERMGEFVSLKGDTSTNFPTSSFYDNYKPVATTGINALFHEISISSASRLKSAASKEGLLSVKKNYLDLYLDPQCLNIAKQHLNNVVMKDGKLYLQQIDSVLPFVTLKRRRN